MYTSIPALHLSSKARAKGTGIVFIQSRSGSPSPSGRFEVRVDVSFDPATDEYPVLTLFNVRAEMTDNLNGSYTGTSIELINSYGKHNPTICFTGRCKFDGQNPNNLKGFKYWIMVANNKQPNVQGTPDMVSFVVVDSKGDRVAYGSGPLQSGDMEVAPM